MDKFSGLKKSFEKIYLKAPKPLGPAMIGPDDEKSGQADVEKRGHKTIQQGLKRADFQLKQSVFYNVLETSVPKPNGRRTAGGRLVAAQPIMGGNALAGLS